MVRCGSIGRWHSVSLGENVNTGRIKGKENKTPAITYKKKYNFTELRNG